MGNLSTRSLLRHLPLVLAMTFLVAVCPILLVWQIRAWGVTSPVLLTLLGVLLSLGASYGGDRAWRARRGVHDLLFNELMIWGFIQRWRIDRQLADAVRLLGFAGDGTGASAASLPRERRSELLTRLASALETRDPYTHGHSRRVARHSTRIARTMSLPRRQVAKVRTAAATHDVGKLNTPLAVLNKSARLTDEEYTVIKRHAADGGAMVAVLGDAQLTAMVHGHHERLDGSGYPAGLRGDDIPLGARIIAVADTFDALTSFRPYRAAKPHREAIAILRQEAGTRLDPDVVRAFCKSYAGRRPLALWTIATNVPQRLATWLGGGANAASASTLGHMVTAAATTAAIGGTSAVALAAPAHPHPHRAPARAAASSRRTRSQPRVQLTAWAAAHGFPAVKTVPGPAGPRGGTGPAGARGNTGPRGAQGGTGAAGPRGARGPGGSAGTPGTPGTTGPRGPIGASGSKGARGATGRTGPAGPLGHIGPQGPASPAGPRGPAGPAGPQGPQGPAGPKGDAGSAGQALGANATRFTGSGATNQPTGQRTVLVTATGLAAGNYLVTFRTTINSDAENIECGLAQSDVNASPELVANGAPPPERDPATFEATGVVAISDPAQSQILYCQGDAHTWDASAPEIDFIPIGSVTEVVGG
jgi:hypothetical protein